MKKFEISLELPKCDTETQWTKAFGKMAPTGLAKCRVATDHQFVKKNLQYLRSTIRCSAIKEGMPKPFT